MGEQRTAAIAGMEAMGFPRDQIDAAMRAAFFNPDRAVEYLLNGIPESARQEQRAAAASPQPAQTQGQQPAATTGTETAPQQASDEPVNLFEAAAQAGGGGRGGSGGRGAGDLGAALGGGRGGAQGGQTEASQLDFLRSNPQFQQLRTVVQQQPQMLEPILQQVAAGNPQLAQIITQNPEAFMQLLAEDAGDDVALPPGAQEISVTVEEREAIERVSVCKGFPIMSSSLTFNFSCAVLDSSETWSFRPILHATRMRSWRLTSYSTSLMSQMSRVLKISRMH